LIPPKKKEKKKDLHKKERERIERERMKKREEKNGLTSGQLIHLSYNMSINK